MYESLITRWKFKFHYTIVWNKQIVLYTRDIRINNKSYNISSKFLSDQTQKCSDRNCFKFKLSPLPNELQCSRRVPLHPWTNDPLKKIWHSEQCAVVKIHFQRIAESPPMSSRWFLAISVYIYVLYCNEIILVDCQNTNQSDKVHIIRLTGHTFVTMVYEMNLSMIKQCAD